MQSKLQSVKWGLALAVFAILLGFTLGTVMGGWEDQIRAHWKTSAQPMLSSVYNNDNQKIADMLDESWDSLLRAHLHAGAIGAACLAQIYLLSRLRLSKIYKQVVSIFLGLGAIGYPFSWYYTAFKAPSLGNVEDAKAIIHPVAALSIGLLLLGTIAVLIPIIIGYFSNDGRTKH